MRWVESRRETEIADFVRSILDRGSPSFRLTPLLAATATSEDRLRGFWSAAGLPLHGEKLQT